jgi:hypothetical protein
MHHEVGICQSEITINFSIIRHNQRIKTVLLRIERFSGFFCEKYPHMLKLEKRTQIRFNDIVKYCMISFS